MSELTGLIKRQKTVDDASEELRYAYWVSQWRYGIRNTEFVMDRLDSIADRLPGMAVELDGQRIVVGGHSAGSQVPLAMYGGLQSWDVKTPISSINDRPIGFLATGPQGPRHAGFQAGFAWNSWYEASGKPLLLVSGTGDDTGEPPHDRVTAWLTSPPGNATLLWSSDTDVRHETMTAYECDGQARGSACERILNVAVAWLDLVVTHRTEARDWLMSGAVEALSNGQHQLHFR